MRHDWRKMHAALASLHKCGVSFAGPLRRQQFPFLIGHIGTLSFEASQCCRLFCPSQVSLTRGVLSSIDVTDASLDGGRCQLPASESPF